MNFVSKFDGSLPFTGTHPKAQTHVETVQGKAPADAIVVKDADLLFNGEFKRAGADLVISRDDHELVLSDYFKGDKRAPLASPDGAFLTGKIVDALTGHVQVAQADGSAGAAKIIGHVTKLNGNATVVRNGVSIILNNGDNVFQGDVVQTGANSTLGITFIDGSVFGLASNAKMVLNEMVYDPNGSSNSSLLSLVQGTISFVAGATAKHGDMKVDTPVATMGIRGTAVLVEIDFEVTVPGSAPPARFQVLVEPDGTSGAFVLLDKVTLAPIATVNQPGTVTTVSGSGAVSFLASAQLSPEMMKLITEVFSLKFTDNTNPKSNTNFTDTVVPEITFPVKFAGGETGTATLRIVTVQEGSTGPSTSPPATKDHIPGPPGIAAFNQGLAERTTLTDSSLVDTVSGGVNYADVNPGDVPTVSTAFDHFGYENAAGQDVTATLTAAQLGAIAAVSVPLVVVQDPNGKNVGTATWTYNVQDKALDFLAAGETLTLTYMARVDNNFAANNEFSFAPFTITITGTNDTPTIESEAQTAAIEELAGEVDSDALDTATGTIEFEDVDLTDTHSVSITGVIASGTVTGLPVAGGGPGAAVGPSNPLYWLSLGDFVDSTDGVTGTQVWNFSAEDHYFDYLAEGETVTLTYTVEVEDINGATVTQEVAVTVTGTNDAPELAIDTSGVNGLHAITELPGTNNAIDDDASGSLTFRDVDLSDSHSVDDSGPTFVWLDANGYPLPLSISQQSMLTLGSTFELALNESTGTGFGSIDFSYSAADYYFDFLAEGETLTISYEVTVLDEHNVASTQPVTITVTGSNDVPVAVADVAAGIVEAGHDANNDPVPGNATTNGNVLTNDTDVDLTDTHEVVGVAAGTATSPLTAGVGASIKGVYGTLVLNEDGTWTYTLDNDDPDTNALPEGAEVSDVFSYTQSDPYGATSTTTLTINITGTNDEPVANAAPAAVADANEGAPVVEAGVNPGNTAFPGVASAEGNVLANDYDVDTGDTKTVQGVVSGTATGPLSGQVGTVVVGTYGTLTLNADGTWTYALDNDNPATQALAKGEVVADVFTYTMHDALGSTSSATLSIAVTGTNDAPVAVADVAAGIVEAGHDANNDPVPGNATTNGNVLTNDTDVDLTDTHEVVGVAAGTATSALSTGVGVAIEGVYGTLTLNADGSWTYTLDNDDPDTDALPEGAEVSDVFSYTQSDPYGATSTTTLTINITGTNDEPVANAAPAAVADVNEGAPVVEAGVNPGNEAFAGVASAEGNVLANDYDVDTGDTKTVQSVTNGTTSSQVAGVVGTQIAGTYGTLTIFADGTWSYALDNDNPATQALAQDVSVADEFTYTMRDTLGSTSSATLSIAITGTNDAPVVAAAGGMLTDTAVDNEFGDITGTLVGSDIDSGETTTLTYAAIDAGTPVNSAVNGQYGALTVNADGTYTYVPNAAAINALGAGSFADTFTIQTTDVNGAVATATFTVDVTGANDTPTLADAGGNLTDTAADDGFGDIAGTLVGNDRDSGETATLTYAAIDAGTPVNSAVNGQYGALTVNADGTYTYVPNAAAINALGAGSFADTFTIQTTDVNGVVATATFTVDVTGVNDAPTFAGADLAATYYISGTPIAFVSGVSASDIDSVNYAGGTLTATVTAGGNEGDTLSIVDNQYIALSGTTVMYDADGDGPGAAVAVGTLSNYDINSLTVTLNGAADDAAIAKIAQAIEFSNSKPDPVVGERTVTFTLHDGGGTANGGQDSAFFTTTVTVAEPATASTLAIQTDAFTIVENGNGTTTVLGLYVTDTDATALTDTFTMTVENDAPLVDGGVAPEEDTGSLAHINSTLSEGVTYDPGIDPPDTDMVTLYVADGQGNNDTVNFIFVEAGTGPATLTGTEQKDVIFATGYDDTLMGLGSADQFVFTPEDAAGADVITDFTLGEDRIDLRAFSGLDTSNIEAWLANPANVSQQGANTVITLDEDNTITLTNVSAANLTASNFIVSQFLVF